MFFCSPPIASSLFQFFFEFRDGFRVDDILFPSHPRRAVLTPNGMDEKPSAEWESVPIVKRTPASRARRQ
jgi:hypothetical protein